MIMSVYHTATLSVLVDVSSEDSCYQGYTLRCNARLYECLVDVAERKIVFEGNSAATVCGSESFGELGAICLCFDTSPSPPACTGLLCYLNHVAL